MENRFGLAIRETNGIRQARMYCRSRHNTIIHDDGDLHSCRSCCRCHTTHAINRIATPILRLNGLKYAPIGPPHQRTIPAYCWRNFVVISSLCRSVSESQVARTVPNMCWPCFRPRLAKKQPAREQRQCQHDRPIGYCPERNSPGDRRRCGMPLSALEPQTGITPVDGILREPTLIIERENPTRSFDWVRHPSRRRRSYSVWLIPISLKHEAIA